MALHRWATLTSATTHGIGAGSTVEVTIIDSGKAMDRDWLVMRAPRAAFTSLTPIRVSERPVTNDESLIAIGWGRGTDWTDIEASALDCPVISASSALTLRCGLTKGDSGGVVARQLENGELEAVGIISSGNSISLSYAFPRGGCPICLTSDLAERARVHQCVIPPALCQTDLFLTLREPSFLLFRVRVITSRTRNSRHIMGRLLLSVVYGKAAGKTLVVTTLL